MTYLYLKSVIFVNDLTVFLKIMRRSRVMIKEMYENVEKYKVITPASGVKDSIRAFISMRKINNFGTLF